VVASQRQSSLSHLHLLESRRLTHSLGWLGLSHFESVRRWLPLEARPRIEFESCYPSRHPRIRPTEVPYAYHNFGSELESIGGGGSNSRGGYHPIACQRHRPALHMRSIMQPRIECML